MGLRGRVRRLEDKTRANPLPELRGKARVTLREEILALETEIERTERELLAKLSLAGASEAEMRTASLAKPQPLPMDEELELLRREIAQLKGSLR